MDYFDGGNPMQKLIGFISLFKAFVDVVIIISLLIVVAINVDCCSNKYILLNKMKTIVVFSIALMQLMLEILILAVVETVCMELLNLQNVTTLIQVIINYN